MSGAQNSHYVHGYTEAARFRLFEQAHSLSEMIHRDSRYSAASRVLEAGCGSGAQSALLASNSPGASFTCVDIDEGSLRTARARCISQSNLRFRRADVSALPFPDGSFDHVFVCFLLEHLPDPAAGLRELHRVVRPSGTITVVEGDHGSVLMWPPSAAARRVIDCQIELQAEGGGDAMIGRRLFPLLSAAGFEGIQVDPRVMYADASRPERIEGFVRRTFIDMISGVRGRAVARELIDESTFDAGLAALERCTERDGSFTYGFFKAVGTRT